MRNILRLFLIIAFAVLLCLPVFGGAMLSYPKFQTFDSNGDPLVGGKLYTYKAGTSTPKATYSNRTCTTANANPVILDSRGEAIIYLSGIYKLVLKDSSDTTVWTIDNITGLNEETVNFYYPDYYAVDQGAAGSSGITTTIKDCLDEIGSENATIYLQHFKDSTTTNYTIGSGVTIPSNVWIHIEPGAQLVVNGSSWIYDSGHIIMAPNQRVVSSSSTKTLYFTNDHFKYSSYNGGTTTVEIPSAKIDTLTLQSGVGINEFSVDTTLGGNSDTVVPTEKAVKTYADTLRLNLALYKTNLRVGPPGYNSGVTPAQIQVTADELMVSNPSGVSLLSSVTAIGIMPTALDTGVEEVKTQYYIWLCWLESGTSPFIKISTSSTTVANLPSTAYRRLVGEVYNDAAGNFQSFLRIGKEVMIDKGLSVANNVTLDTTWTAYSLPSGVSNLPITGLIVEGGGTGAAATAIAISCKANPDGCRADLGLSIGSAGFSNYYNKSMLYDAIIGRLVWTGVDNPTQIWLRANRDASQGNQCLSVIGYILER